MTPGPSRVDVHVHLSAFWENQPTSFYAPDLEFTVPGLLRELDAEGIGHAVLLQLDTAPHVADTLEEGARLAKESHGRLLRTSTVNPLDGPDVVAEALRAWEATPDLVAIKLYPGYFPFYPHDPRLEPLYAFAARRNLVVMIHQGDTLSPDGLVKFARPIEVDEVAVRHREVRFVLCHLGNPWVEEAAEVVYKNENVYADTSGLVWSPRLPFYDAMVERAQRRLANAIATMGTADRVLYGSDWPLESIALAVKMVEGLDLPSSARAQILGGNARKLFRLPPPEG
ncbi:MAG: amidohydrolase family protein [Thermoplasmata archaeon]|nr:amidohydrolase family protein [Thermoplasmata archaeon]